jgi:hypothetical protein
VASKVTANCVDFSSLLPCKLLQGEISSLSCEQHAGSELVVSLFEVPFNAESVAAFIAREHEFRFLAVQPYDLAGQVPTERLAVSADSKNNSTALIKCGV